ncbi:MAG: FKBP-type peptidyl-prolyl cis-trans isomerase [Terriglobales bacterium]
MKTGRIIVALAVAMMIISHSASAQKGDSGPTKVTGDPIKTASGLQYWDIKVGTGAVAEAGHKVRVDYTGWLTDGKKFDSSVGTGRPFEFHAGRRAGHQGLGPGRRGHEGWREAAAADSSGAGLWG